MQMTSEQLMQMNAINRAQLIATSPRSEKKVTSITVLTLGQTSRVKLFNVGIITKLNLVITAAVTIGTAIATPSPKAPYNLITRLRVSDYDGTDRVNLSGFQLYLINTVRARKPYLGMNRAGATAQFTNPTVPTAVGAGTILFQTEVPLAYDPDNDIVPLRDLRGAIMAQTGVGELYLTIDWATTLYTNLDSDAVYNGAPTTTVVLAAAGITMDVYQEFLLPQALRDGRVALPQADLMTVYELNGFTRSADNIALNQDKLIAYPNMRSVLGAYMTYMQALTMLTGKINTIKLIGNGNTTLVERNENRQLGYQRDLLDSDLPGGCYFLDHRDKPVETALWGNVQFLLNPSVVGATPSVEILWESFVTKGQILPGIQQGT